MSSESHTIDSPGVSPQPTRSRDVCCSFCAETAGPALALQCYAPAEGAMPAGVDPGDGVVLCSACAEEVIELLGAWSAHDPPVVDSGEAIGEGYSNGASSCSFCTGPLETDAVTGVELYDSPAEALPGYANYTLCPDCRGVFGEFLCNVRSEC